MMKACSKCGVTKEVSEFYFSNRAKGYLRANCKKCADKQTKAWSDANPARRKNIDQVSAKKHAEARASYRKSYKEENWQYFKDYRINNLEKCRAYARKSQDKIRLATKAKVFEHYGMQCACCGESTLMFLTIDHINNNGAEHRRKLKSAGGSSFFSWIVRNNFPDGFQTLCRNCNWGKHANHGICPHQSP